MNQTATPMNPAQSIIYSLGLLNTSSTKAACLEPITAVFVSSASRFAQSLLSIYSFVEYHPNSECVFVLTDECESVADLESFLPSNMRFVLARDIGIPDFESFAFSYNSHEFACDTKPFALLHAIKHTKNKKIFYCDGDLLFFAPLYEAVEALNQSSLVLTPTRTGPTKPFNFGMEEIFVHSGIYNAGFVGLCVSPEAFEFLEWWKNVLWHGGIFDTRRSADQTWLNCAKLFFRKTEILMHAGYNVAFWNLDERALDFSRNPPMVGSEELRFMHLSGILKNSTESLLPDDDYFKFNKKLADATSLPFMHLYRESLTQLMSLPKMPSSSASYAYDYFDDGTKITQKIRRGYHALNSYPHFKNPFSSQHKRWLFQQFEPSVLRLFLQKTFVFLENCFLKIKERAKQIPWVHNLYLRLFS